jgi:hypothetical protein
MKCKGTEDCPARKNTDIPCWEFVKKIDDYRRVFNICKDCVVYMLKGNNTVLSEVDIKSILENRGICVLA